MNEHEQVLGIIRAKNSTPIELDPRHTALIVVDMQRYFTQPSYPFTQVYEKLSPGGVIALVHQPRNPGATEDDATKAGDRFARYLKAAEF